MKDRRNDEEMDGNTMAGMGITRRGFLGMGAAAGAAAALAGLAGCSPKTASSRGASSGTSAGSYSFETAPDAVPDSKIAVTETYDVVVVGGSSAGLSAAAAAAETGAKTICIEKTDKAQGAGTYYGFINTKLLANNGVATVDENEYANKLIQADLGAVDPKLVRAYVKNAGAVGDWLADIATSTGNKALFSSAMGSENTIYLDDGASGSSAYGALTSYGISKGASYIYNTEVVRIERGNDGRVTGVIAKGVDDSYTRYTASKGVVLATGAYNGNRDMVEKYLPWLDLDTTTEYNPLASNGNTGDGLKMALWIGARIGSVPHCPMVHFIKGAMPMSGSLFVNGAGKRFMDEGTSMEVIAQTVMRQPGHTMYQIGDAKPSGMALAASAGSGSASDPSANFASSGKTFDTLDALALAHGMDAAVLNATVARWNELVARHVDEDFGSNFAIAQTIDTPPYSIAEAPGCRLAMMGGPQVDADQAVLDEDYAPIPGLYAAGNCTSGFFGPNYPMQVQSGIARAYSVVSGYRAAKNAIAG